MHLRSSLCLALLPLLVSTQEVPHRPQYSTHNYYVLEHDPSAASVADATRALGVEVVQQAGALRDHWVVRAPKGEHNTVLANHRAVQHAHLGTRSAEARHIASSVRALLPQTPRQRTKRDAYLAAPPIRPPTDKNATTSPSPARELASRLGIADPIFPQQWHFINEEFPEHMMNVTSVWEELGITGKGVYVAMVDDGIDYEHDDLKDNFFAEGSYDFNDHEPLPKPKLLDDRHGTRCAGEISAVKNDVCGVGVAYNSKIAGLRILSGYITDIEEATALNYAYQNTSIYSCSWGPADDGRSMDAPSYLVQKAVLEGVQNGRGGKGSIFVFASGNGAFSGDQCNFDGYTNSIYSVTVAAVDYTGKHPPYSEGCAANMVVTYSSGSNKHIRTTDVGQGKCSASHGGTSAAAPLASGVFALALEARPDLTWRDIQHLCVRTGVAIYPNDPDWEKTAAGRPYSYKYGYGRLDAWQYVNAAKTWSLVKPQAWVDMPISQVGGGKVDAGGAMLGGLVIVSGGVGSSLTVSHDLLLERNFEKLEHVTVTAWINHTTRGDVEVELRSPSGIRSMLAGPRPHDSDASGYPGWTFMTIKHWDENPIGDWMLHVFDQGVEGSAGRLLGWTMSLFGSCIDASAAVPYTLSPVAASPGNPRPAVSPTITPGGAKLHPKPTAHLPGAHGAIPTKETQSPSAGQNNNTITPPSGGELFGGMPQLSNPSWLLSTFGVVVVLMIGAGLFCWRRRARRGRDDYTRVARGEDVQMEDQGSRMSRDGGPANELDGTFENSDEDVDEERGLRRPMGSGGSGFRTGDGPASVPYTDEPDGRRRAAVSERGER